MICRICETEFELNHFNQKLCSTECKSKSRSATLKKYKVSKKGIESENRWRKSDTRKDAQKRYKLSEQEKEYAKNRSAIYRATRRGHLKKWWLTESSKGCNKCKASENLSVDHIVPFSKSRDNSIKNLQVLCLSCNGKKGGEQWQK